MNTRDTAPELKELSNNFHKTATNLKEIVSGMRNKGYRVNLDMSIGEPQEYIHECRTVGCVAGFYALSDPESEFKNNKFSFNTLENPKWLHNYTFEGGCELFAIDLGFKCPPEVEEWAKNHPSLWGHTHGIDFFLSERAWGKEICDD